MWSPKGDLIAFTRQKGGQFGVGPTLWRVPVVLAHLALPTLAGWMPVVALTLVGAVWLMRRDASAVEHGVWQFGAFAALGPKFMPMYAIAWAPFLCVWAASEASRRRWLWWHGLALPLAWFLDSGPLQGLFGPVWCAVAAARAPEPDMSLSAFMRKKLDASSEILEGLAVEDAELISKGAKALLELSKAEKWQILTDSGYREYSSEFRSTVRKLNAAAEKGNFDNAALQWFDATKACIECHRHVRNERNSNSKETSK